MIWLYFAVGVVLYYISVKHIRKYEDEEVYYFALALGLPLCILWPVPAFAYLTYLVTR